MIEYQWEEVGISKGLMRVNKVDAFIFIYENKSRRPIEIVLRDREEGRGRMMEGINRTKMHCEHIGKYHNVSPCGTIKNKSKTF
jgi:hypothetical protein